MIGRLIDGRYQVRSRIARGGMATVYLATDLRLERRVAIKIMHGHLADDDTFKTRFVQEARSAARLAHPNVVNVFDQGQDSDMAYMVMEYLPGITLRDLLKDYGKLTPEQTVDIVTAVLGGLAAAHKAGIVHRDLKPENVLLADDGRIKLGDFGLARAASANTATGQALLGTIAYLSPELVTRGVADARSDIYALGIMMYEMLTGEQPFVGEAPMQIAYQHANDSVPAPSLKVPGLPRELDELVLWASARDPEDRPRDAGAMLEQLLAVTAGMPGAVDPNATAATTVLPGPLAQTMVLGGGALANGVDDFAGSDFGGSEAETQILGARHRTGPVDAAEADSAVLLRGKASTRKRRGYWLFAAIVLLAGLAAGTGWYFGSGPGSRASVPDVSGQSVDVATAAIAQAGLQPADATASCTHPSIKPDLVASTDPAIGTALPRGSTVTLCVSTGPAIIGVPAVVGLPEADARAELAPLFTLAEASDVRFTDEQPAGSVIAVLDADGNPVAETAYERSTMSLVVSAGPVPNVAGMGVDEATETLTQAGLEVETTDPVFDSNVPDGAVISASPQGDGPVRPGSTIVLTVSKGPDLIAIPDVVGMSLQDAIQTLKDAGFEVSHNFPEALIVLAKAVSTDPPAGELLERGSSVFVKAQVTF
ncbi:Stk1 family PASTA domain-containing Ser/Thr kinase [Microterricola viridarii]|uniref:non-specific serine/threonine protein kinase n=1 Tax=Microterricola viridarii TaxID=412690 RepID=A0A1H1W042_9MICO|nr:Stk1 family PASTA domain-containing Ser/Thr kinase [Microterricola viridarii]SDS90070.1 serine/threonine protein kinase [Microterricola viridarii]